MPEWISFNSDRAPWGRIWKSLLAAGLAMIGLAVLIFFVPEILVALAASVFMFVGALLVMSAWQMRKSSALPNWTGRYARVWADSTEWN